MKWALVVFFLVFLGVYCVPAEGRVDPSDRTWIALALISLLSERGSSEPGIFYSWQYQFEPGILVRMEAKKRLTPSLGVTNSTFTLGPSLRVGESRFHLSGGVASEQDRISTFPFLCLSWRWSVYY